MVDVMIGWLFVLGAVAFNATASITLKLASNNATANRLSNVDLSGFLIYGLSGLLYVGAFVFYALALRSLPLHIAQPMTTALPIGLVAIASVVYFGERIGPLGIVALAVIGLGVLMLGISSR
jgi:small multidrug resistance pump